MSPRFEIQLEQDTFHKSVYDDTNSLFLLRGKVLLVSSSSLGARHISLTFRGEFVLNRGLQATRKVLFEQKRHFSLEEASGQHTFAFEFPLPADLPETATASYGKIQYSLKAAMETSLFWPKITAQKDVYICRDIDPLACMSYNTHLEATWNDLVDYEIIIPCPEYTPGDSIPIYFKHRLLSSKCRLLGVWAGLDEKTEYKKIHKNIVTEGDVVRSHLQTSAKAIESNSDSSFLSIPIPKSPKEVHLHCTTPYMKVYHILYARIQVELDGELRSILSILPIYIVSNTSNSSTPEALNGMDQLPSYYAVKLDCPPDYSSCFVV
ncbi:hypothetical protein K493DRAFT_366828 [Basidiobolus meristosporus CBS 931.73]|uniref:Arrestin C-terminal-like domain-containing protein n=1 Tax=Basidiobolus meristosporus CBS 931.73 TaxID=1314790 RepID=A0A1Y1YM82_9FUNG|nr:hypothetical protein K493DRAFT_366828 [Basidiobolus meristosporus CBS 931.73]|eukprot:ORX98694.1 hypothetical protein K493DRAFT_366828 [Basidiobolus meristosporus CBS 931.73]